MNDGEVAIRTLSCLLAYIKSAQEGIKLESDKLITELGDPRPEDQLNGRALLIWRLNGLASANAQLTAMFLTIKRVLAEPPEGTNEEFARAFWRVLRDSAGFAYTVPKQEEDN